MPNRVKRNTRQGAIVFALALVILVLTIYLWPPRQDASFTEGWDAAEKAIMEEDGNTRVAVLRVGDRFRKCIASGRVWRDNGCQ